jgi:hypothetical protein
MGDNQKGVPRHQPFKKWQNQALGASLLLKALGPLAERPGLSRDL